MKRFVVLGCIVAMGIAAVALTKSADAQKETAPRPAERGTWSASGTLLESCTCAVPCTCNFGEGPSPNHYCYAVFAYRIDRGSYDGVDVSGLVIGGADGPKGQAGLLDERATPAQRPALEKMALLFYAQGGPVPGKRPFAYVPITHEAKNNRLRLDFGGERGGFTGRVILGRDGVSPLVVENNKVWPVRRAIKGKAASLSYRDTLAGEFTGEGTNANFGEFSFAGKISGAAARGSVNPVPIAQRKAGHQQAKTASSCCAAPDATATAEK